MCNIKSHIVCYKFLCKIAESYDINEKIIRKTINQKYSDPNTVIAFYSQCGSHFKIFCQIIKHINNITDDIKCKFVFFMFDFWNIDGHVINRYLKESIKCKNAYTIVSAKNVDELNYLHGDDFSQYKNNIIHFKLWCSYDIAFIKFNDNPINKIGLFGETRKDKYPERDLIKQFVDYVDHIQYNFNEVNENNEENSFENNSFNHQLNKYVCCFTSSIHARSKTSNKWESVHTILLKVFEILASGSLLMYPLSEKIFIETLGLKENIHYVTCDCSNEQKIIEKITYVLNNRREIDIIRLGGQEYAKKNLNEQNKIEEIKKIFESL